MESIYIFFNREYDDPIDFIAAVPEPKFQEFLENKFQELERKAEIDKISLMKSENLVNQKFIKPYERFIDENTFSNGESIFGVKGRVSYYFPFDETKKNLITSEVVRSLSYVKIPITQ